MIKRDHLIKYDQMEWEVIKMPGLSKTEGKKKILHKPLYEICSTGIQKESNIHQYTLFLCKSEREDVEIRIMDSDEGLIIHYRWKD